MTHPACRPTIASEVTARERNNENGVRVGRRSGGGRRTTADKHSWRAYGKALRPKTNNNMFTLSNDLLCAYKDRSITRLLRRWTPACVYIYIDTEIGITLIYNNRYASISKINRPDSIYTITVHPVRLRSILTDGDFESFFIIPSGK